MYEPNESLTQTINNYLAVKATATARASYGTLRKLAKFFSVKFESKEFEVQLRRFTVRDAMAFIFWLRNEKAPDGSTMADATIRQRIALLRRLFRHLSAVGVVLNNPFDAVADSVPHRRKKQKRPTKMIPFEKVVEILNTPSANTKEGIRDRALLSLLFGGALRRNEAVKLNVNDVASTPTGVPFLIIRDAKAGDDQHQSLPDWAWERFSILISQRKAEGCGERDPLFCFYYKDGRVRGRLGSETVRHLYRRYCIETGVGDASPHSARATAASWLKYLDHDDRDVAHFLRHSTTQMVAVYDKRVRSPANSLGRKIDYSNENQRKTT